MKLIQYDTNKKEINPNLHYAKARYMRRGVHLRDIAPAGQHSSEEMSPF